jgi:hypothetical protein
MPITHPFVSGKADGTDTTRVRPSNWNASHTLSGGSTGQTVIRDAGQADGSNFDWRTRVLNVNTTTVGNVGAGTDDLMTYALPASTMSTNGMTIRVTVAGRTAANANVKTVTFNFGATAITINPTTAAPNAQNWRAVFEITRVTASTEILFGDTSFGAVQQGVFRAAPAETLSSAVTIKCTGLSGSSATDDIQQDYLLVEALNC